MKNMLLIFAAALALLVTRSDVGMDNIDTFAKCYPDSNCCGIP